jgi:hypothetical protein
MHRDDLKVLAPQWLNYTHIMRNDMEVGGDHRAATSSVALAAQSAPEVMVCVGKMHSACYSKQVVLYIL